MRYPHILTRNALTVFAGGVALTIHNDDSRWDRALELWRADQDEDLVELMNPAKAVQKALDAGLGAASGLSIVNGMFMINGAPVDANTQDYTIRQILDFNAQGLPFEPLVNFYNRLLANPSFRVRRDLLQFLEYGKLPITSDGYFMAYKRVRADFRDVHSGSLDYTPGNVVVMARELVDDDPTHTCSAGLHVCSYEYLHEFSGDKVLACKVDPADVVSIPVDYNNTKMRVCRLTVVEEIPMPDRQNVWDAPVVPGWDVADTSVEDEDEEDEPKREPKFKFGDRVTYGDETDVGVITQVDEDGDYYVQFEGINPDDGAWYDEHELQLA